MNIPCICFFLVFLSSFIEASESPVLLKNQSFEQNWMLLKNLKSLPQELRWYITSLYLEAALQENYTHSYTLKDQDFTITSIAVSRQSDRFLVGSIEGICCLYDNATGQKIYHFSTGIGWIDSILLSPDSSTALTLFGNEKALTWNLSTGKCMQRFKGHSDVMCAAAYSPDGLKVVTTSKDKTARLWDSKTGLELTKCTGHTAIVTSVAFSPNGKTLLTGSYDTTVRLWDCETGRHIQSYEGQKEKIKWVAFSPDGYRVVARTHKGKALFWDAKTGQPLIWLNNITSIAFVPGTTSILVEFFEEKIYLLDSISGKKLFTFNNPYSPATLLESSYDGKTIFIGAKNGSLSVWKKSTTSNKILKKGIVKKKKEAAFKLFKELYLLLTMPSLNQLNLSSVDLWLGIPNNDKKATCLLI